jgi:hypothetical protein
MILIPNLRAREWGWPSTPRPDRYGPEVESQNPMHRRLSGLRDQCGRVRKISLSEGFEPRTVQRVDSRCINYAIPTAITLIEFIQYIYIYVRCLYIHILFTWELLT